MEHCSVFLELNQIEPNLGAWATTIKTPHRNPTGRVEPCSVFVELGKPDCAEGSMLHQQHETVPHCHELAGTACGGYLGLFVAEQCRE